MGEPYRTRRLVEFADTDMAGIAHFSGYFRWMESAEHELLRSVEQSVYTPVDGGQVLSFPRVSAACDYRAPIRYGDSLEIAVSISRLGEKSVTYAFEFTQDGRLVAEGTMTSVCCQMVEGAAPVSVAIPESIAERLRPFVVA